MQRLDGAGTRKSGTANCTVRRRHHRVMATELTDREHEQLR
jgi:hypothetical protein